MRRERGEEGRGGGLGSDEAKTCSKRTMEHV